MGGDPNREEARWALALHGGAGAISRERLAGREGEYEAVLRAALAAGAERLAAGASSVDVVEEVVRRLEDDPHFNAGRGAVYNRDGFHELDAAIMRGSDLSCGAVAAVRRVRNPVRLARHVMEHTAHVLVVGEGAERLAEEAGVELVEPAYFHTDARREELDRRLAGREEPERPGLATVGAVARDLRGGLAAATSTGGTTGKLPGRVGDVPVIGAGTYADDRFCAVSGTGRGEELIRHSAAAAIALRMQLLDADLGEAVAAVVHETLRPGSGGVVAVAASGALAMELNTEGMFRAAADSAGRFETAIW